MAQQPDRKFEIERLKMLGAIEFRGTTEPKEVEKWIGHWRSYLELCNV